MKPSDTVWSRAWFPATTSCDYTRYGPNARTARPGRCETPVSYVSDGIDGLRTCRKSRDAISSAFDSEDSLEARQAFLKNVRLFGSRWTERGMLSWVSGAEALPSLTAAPQLWALNDSLVAISATGLRFNLVSCRPVYRWNHGCDRWSSGILSRVRTSASLAATNVVMVPLSPAVRQHIPNERVDGRAADHANPRKVLVHRGNDLEVDHKHQNHRG